MKKPERAWLDDNGEPVQAVSAERHAMNKISHVLTVKCRRVSRDGGKTLVLGLEIMCQTCGWWDEQLFPIDPEEPVQIQKLNK